MTTSRFRLSNSEFFTSRGQYVYAVFFILVSFSLSVLMEYFHYQKFSTFTDYVTDAQVVKQYKKNKHWVLKLHSNEGFSFYTSSWDDLKDLKGKELSVRIFTNDVSFIDFVRGFYAPTQLLYMRSEKPYSRELFMQMLASEHDALSAQLYNALYFAGPIDQTTREKLSAWGINHLLAISGFHLGVLSAVLFFLLRLVYIPLHRYHFPYRHGHRDIFVLVFGVLFVYLYFLDFVPSLLRAFAMSLFAYFLYDRGMKLLSFSSLFLVVGFLVALWPKLLFSLGFWFSVSGVFYIFLFLHHFQWLKPWQIFILLHFWVYLAMLPVVHYFFGSFSLAQLFSPFLTMGFILFYPLSLLLHLLQHGEVLDGLLRLFFSVDIVVHDFFISFYLFIFYLIFSLLAIFHRFIFYGLLFFDLMLLGYFLYGVT
jgi:competence protein ComEC